MKRISRPAELRNESRCARRGGRRIGLVPTMGYLHQGHLRLVRRCREECDLAVVSIFVNPAQFGPSEDFHRYPRDLGNDTRLLEEEGVDLLFAPEDGVLYPAGYATWLQVERLTEGLCGRHRPDHVRGVCTVVAKLFNIADPDAAYFGQKDWQQAMVLRRMVRDLDLDIDMVICPTFREADGLAMSSRNALLSGAEREVAPLLYRALQEGARMAREGDRSAARITRRVEERLADTPFRLQYVETLAARDLQRRKTLTGEVVLAAAAFLGSTRLIDNVLIDLPPEERPA